MSESDIRSCPHRDECTEGNRFGKGCVEDPLQSAMGGKPWHECHCGVDGDGNPPNQRQADTITALRAELANQIQWVKDLADDLIAEEAKTSALRAKVERLEATAKDSLDRRKLAKRLAARYNHDPLRIAELCDGAIDPTGRLLGYVREEARTALGDTHE